jgi:FAD/FMN-containing dehydrogenase
MIDATCAGDVVAGVKLAIQQNCQVAVCSGGHSMFVWSLQNDSLLIDLGNWKEIVVEADSSIAKVSPSTIGEELNNQLQAYGLTT